MSDLIQRAKKESAFAPANGVVRDLYFEMIKEIERLQRENELLKSSGLQSIHDEIALRKRILRLESMLDRFGDKTPNNDLIERLQYSSRRVAAGDLTAMERKAILIAIGEAIAALAPVLPDLTDDWKPKTVNPDDNQHSPSPVPPEDVQKALEICNYNGYIYYSDRKKLYDLIERLQRENEQARKRVKELKEGHRQYDERCRRLESMLDRLIDEAGLARNLIGEKLYYSADNVLRECLEYAASHRSEDNDRS